MKVRNILQVIVASVCLCICPAVQANDASTEFVLPRKSISILNSYTTKGTSADCAARGPDGSIWIPSIYGVITRVDPKSPHLILAEVALKAGVTCLKPLLLDDNRFRCMFVGTPSGYYCFGAQGQELVDERIRFGVDDDPIQFGSRIILVSGDGTPYELDDNFKSKQLSKQDLYKIVEDQLSPDGFRICSSSALIKSPNPELIFITEEKKVKDSFM